MIPASFRHRFADLNKAIKQDWRNEMWDAGGWKWE
jgi:hypothetical protein